MSRGKHDVANRLQLLGRATFRAIQRLNCGNGSRGFVPVRDGSPPGYLGCLPQESTMTPADPYWKLRPAPPTPADEICRCNPCEQLMLRDSLGENPLYCVACNGEVLPERIGFDDRLAEDIAGWRSVHRSLYLLWLDSGEYGHWADEKLRDPKGSVNVNGRNIVQRLNEFVRAYYWWFNDTGVDDYVAPQHCPVCSGKLAECGDREFQKCDKCLILI